VLAAGVLRGDVVGTGTGAGQATRSRRAATPIRRFSSRGQARVRLNRNVSGGRMRISELSRRTSVPVATIKFYLREQLLPPGTLTARNQASYGAEHVERLRLVRVLTDVGGLGLSSVGAILAGIDDDQLSLHDLCRVVHRALVAARSPDADSPGFAEARAGVDEYIDDSLGWSVASDAPERDTVANVLAGLRRLGWECDATVLAPYAEAAERLASTELAFLPTNASRAEAAATFVVGSVLLETAMVGLRRLAQEHHSAVRFAGVSPEAASNRCQCVRTAER